MNNNIEWGKIAEWLFDEIRIGNLTIQEPQLKGSGLTNLSRESSRAKYTRSQ